MAAFSTTTDFGGRSFATRLLDLSHGISRRYQLWANRRATRIELQNLSAQALDDIGLTRWDVNNMY